MSVDDTSVYPSDLDGYATLPLRRNLIDEIRAEDHNRLRNAIIKIQQELGIQPSGTYATVSARLDDIGDVRAIILAHIADPTDAHDASAISVLDTADNYFEDDVEKFLKDHGYERVEPTLNSRRDLEFWMGKLYFVKRQ